MGLLDRFRPIIAISADPGAVVFRGDTTEVREQPLIRVLPDGKIVALGAEALQKNEGQLIRLFAGDRPQELDAMRAFCRYHILRVSAGTLSLRPRLTVDAPSLRRVFGRDAAQRVHDALVADRFDVELAVVA